MTREEKSAEFNKIIENAKNAYANIDQNLHPMQVKTYQLFIEASMMSELLALSATPIEQAEPDYKDLLRRYALHVGEYAETTYTELELSYNHITADEAGLINKLIEQ